MLYSVPVCTMIGAHLECIYELMTYGISPEPLPVTLDGELKRKNHLDWIKMRRWQEERSPPGTQIIIVPAQADVLFGRGKPFREHIGNMRLHDLLDEKVPAYERALLKEKTAMIAEIVKIIRLEGGRFLKQENNAWINVDDKQAKEKVSHGFRTRIKIALNSGSTASTNWERSERRRKCKQRKFSALVETCSSDSESNSSGSAPTSPSRSPMLKPDEFFSFNAPSIIHSDYETEGFAQRHDFKRQRHSPELDQTSACV